MRRARRGAARGTLLAPAASAVVLLLYCVVTATEPAAPHALAEAEAEASDGCNATWRVHLWRRSQRCWSTATELAEAAPQHAARSHTTRSTSYAPSSASASLLPRRRCACLLPEAAASVRLLIAVPNARAVAALPPLLVASGASNGLAPRAALRRGVASSRRSGVVIWCSCDACHLRFFPPASLQRRRCGATPCGGHECAPSLWSYHKRCACVVQLADVRPPQAALAS